MDINIKAPAHTKRVKYRTIEFGVNPDGTVDCPKFAVPELVKAGCYHDNAVAIDVRKELQSCPDHHLSIFLNAREIADHWFDADTHYHSAKLRELSKTSPMQIVDGENKYELFSDVADHLDSLHRVLHKGGGRIVCRTTDEKRQMALDIHDQESKG